MKLVFFLESASLWKNIYIGAVYIAYIIALWEFVGLILFVDRCARLHELFIGFWHEKIWFVFKFTTFGTFSGRIYFWMDWRLFATQKHESDIRSKNFLHLLWVRIFFRSALFWLSLTLAHIIPGILLLMVPYINNTSIIISCLTISLGFNGAATLTNLQNCQDLGPNHAGTLYSIINFIGLSSGFFGPLLKGKLVELGPIVSTGYYGFAYKIWIY